MTDVMGSLVRAVRLCLRTPWTTLAIVITIALGTGLNAAVIAVTYGILVRPLPYADASRLVVFDRDVKPAEVAEWRHRMSAVEDVAGFAGGEYAMRGPGPTRIVRIAFVTDGFFDILQPSFLAGRAPSALARANAVVVSERLVRQAGLTPAQAIGRSVTLVDRAFTVAAVVPEGVAFPHADTEAWLPAEAADAIALVRDDDRRYGVLGRLVPGATFERATEEGTRIARETGTYLSPGERRSLRVRAERLGEAVERSLRPVLWAFTAGAVLVLIIACANVAGLLLGRIVDREADFAVAVALGASRARILTGLLVEGLVLACAGSALGLWLASGALALIRSHGEAVLPRLESLRVDTPIMAVAAVVACLVAVACTAGPAMHVLRRGIAPMVRQTGAHGLHLRRRLHAGLAGAQIALSVVLLVGATLLGRTVLELLAVDTGARHPRQVLTMKLMLGDRALLRPGERDAVVGELLDRVRRLPGVRVAGVGTSLPPVIRPIDMRIRVVDGARDESMNMALVPATHGFIEAVGIPIVRGRSLREEDAAGVAPTVLVSRAVARHLFGDRDAVGLTLPTATPGTRGQKPRVVGVVEDARLSGLVEPPGGAVYVPWNHLPLAVVHLAVRTDGDPMVLAPSIRRVIQEVDPTVATGEARSLDALIVSSVAERRFYATVAAGFGLLALNVALVGLAATLGRLVAVRRHEFAVRMALGATPREAAGLLVRHAAVIVLAGLGAGTVLAVFASRGLGAYLYGVSASDAGTYVMVLAGTALASALGCGLPAWRVTSIEPGALLRSE